MEYLYETHMHTLEGSGCGMSTAAEQVKAYKERGYQGIIITDHFINGYSTCPRSKRISWEEKMAYVVSGYEVAKKAGDICGLDVFLGWEFTVRGSDFLTYGLDWDFLMAHPNLDKLNVQEYSVVVRKNGGFLAQAHPYRDLSYIQHKLPVDPQYVDAIEIYNASDPKSTNEKARKFAQNNNLPIQAGSDSHYTDIRFASGIKLDRKAENIHHIIEAIKNKKVSLILP
ncbi:MAG: PHP domain-containing protein [Defluviitaleaceae bacterium]|nr:PHP domain-containing protein [Defluviitaleaceae bacterium]